MELVVTRAVENIPEEILLRLKNFLTHQPVMNSKIEDKMIILKIKLASLLHTYHCGKKEINQGKEKICDVKRCRIVGKMWQHLKLCHEGDTCTVAFCVPTKRLLMHWLCCNSDSCVVCSTFPNLYTEASLIKPGAKKNPIKKFQICIRPKCPKKWSRGELIEAFMPQLNRLFAYEKEVKAFMRPVDPLQDFCPDYHQIVATPMDFGTIMSGLDAGEYVSPSQLIHHIQLVFVNAWLYNHKSSIYHKYACKLADVFEKNIDVVMRKLGFCCGQRYEYTPLPKHCDTLLCCTIPVLAHYYSYNDQYACCEMCFNNSFNTIHIHSTNPPLVISKSDLVKKRNLDRKLERMVGCSNCGRLNHVICVMHQYDSPPFVCQLCKSSQSHSLSEPLYRARDIDSTKCSDFIEDELEKEIKGLELVVPRLVVRVVSSNIQTTKLKPKFRQRFPNMPTSFPYTSKFILVFQEQPKDVCLMAIQVQEYSSQAPPPNTRRVYLAYLDSVNAMQPPHIRSRIYHTILQAYITYIKLLGFWSLHIWSCPPTDGDEYIFNCHPRSQKVPKARRLHEWYTRLLQEAVSRGIIHRFDDMFTYSNNNDWTKVTDIPYFHADFWPSAIEDHISQVDLCGSDVLFTKIHHTLNKFKQMFFVVSLHSSPPTSPIIDPDPHFINDIFHDRLTFLMASRQQQAEFSSPRRTQHSTQFILRQLLHLQDDKQGDERSALGILEHASGCLSCLDDKCALFKKVIAHAQTCTDKVTCVSCHSFITLVFIHARSCGSQALEGVGSGCNEGGRAVGGRCNEGWAGGSDGVKDVSLELGGGNGGVDERNDGIEVNCRKMEGEMKDLMEEGRSELKRNCCVMWCGVAKEELSKKRWRERKIGERILIRRTAAMMEGSVDGSGGDGDGCGGAGGDGGNGEHAMEDFQRMGSI